MLRKTRIILAALFLIGITLLFTGIGHQWWGWMAKLQFLPSCLALNFAVIAGILLLTFVFGRIYCSVICPLGVFQDCVIWLRRKYGMARHKRNVRNARKIAEARKAGTDIPAGSTIKPEVKHFRYENERKWLRYGILAIVTAAIFANLQVIVAAIAPYSAYGRMVRSIAGLASGESIAPALLVTAGITLLVIVIYSWFWGRAWCNIICPVGSLLSIVSRFSLLRIRIDGNKCTACGRCERGCKSSCINTNTRTVDASRCVDCFDCIGRCKEGAISFGPAAGRGSDDRKKADDTPDRSRRDFLATAAILATAGIEANAQEKRLDGGLAPVTDKAVPERTGRLVPPGAGSADSFYSRCTACQLCVSNCPNGVLRPSTDLSHLLQPEMGYEKGFCRPECTVCSEVCPAGAIRPVSREEKLTIHIGTATVDAETCIGCGKCTSACPTGAVMMVFNDGRNVAAVAEEQCIGCGKCEFLCPVRPLSAIKVNGLDEHRKD